MKRTRVSTQVGVAVSALVVLTLLLHVLMTQGLMYRAVEQARDTGAMHATNLVTLVARAGPIQPGALEPASRNGFFVGVYDQTGRAISLTDGVPQWLDAPTLAAARSADGLYSFDSQPRAKIKALAEPAGAVHYIAVADGGTGDAVYNTRVWGLVFITFVSAVAALIATAWLSRHIRKRLLAARAVVRRVAEGELGVRFGVRSDDETGELAADFNRMAHRLGQQFDELRREGERRRRIFADWTHEIATPLTGVLGYLEALESESLEPQRRRRYVCGAYAQARAMESLVEDLGALSRLETEGLRLVRASFELGAVLRAEVDAAALRTAEVDVLLKAPSVTRCVGDAARLAQVVRNLLTNAERYALQCITVECSTARGGYLISVEDDGPGIAPEHLAHITEDFYRADESRDRGTGGRGLGLSIARRIVEAHEGEMTLASEVGVGTKVSVWLPRGIEGPL